MAEASPGIPNPNQEAGSASSNLRAQKVELDLDDAPFLKVEKQKPIAEAIAPESPKQPEEEVYETPGAEPLYKRPLVWGVSGIVILLIVFGTILLVSGSRAPKPPGTLAVQEAPQSVLFAHPPPAAPEPLRPERFLVNLEPFLVLLQSREGQRLLTFKFSVYANGMEANTVMQEKELYLRNTVYNFLRTQNEEELTRPQIVNSLKAALRQVLTAALPDVDIGEVLIEHIHVQPGSL